MEWQPIETAPRDGTEILVQYDHGSVEKLVFSDNSWRQACDGTLKVTGKGVLFWMPLPKAIGIKRSIVWYKATDKLPPSGVLVVKQDGVICLYEEGEWLPPLDVIYWSEIPTLKIEGAITCSELT